MGALAIAAERDLRVSGLHLATSADVGADASRVVGYGAFAFEYAASARLNDADRGLLLSTAMAALSAATRGAGQTPSLGFDGRLSPALSSQRATFVTLSSGGKLRGCIGSPAPRSSADRGCGDECGAGGVRRSALPASRRSRTRRHRDRRLDPLPSAPGSGGQRSRTGRGARARPRRAHSRGRRVSGRCFSRVSGGMSPIRGSSCAI